jgi:hypothetical protein
MKKQITKSDIKIERKGKTPAGYPYVEGTVKGVPFAVTKDGDKFVVSVQNVDNGRPITIDTPTKPQ